MHGQTNIKLRYMYITCLVTPNALNRHSLVNADKLQDTISNKPRPHPSTLFSLDNQPFCAT